ncbi:MAG: polysaccharide deacetylase family protein [Candidatus Coatesbacteria bacterium]|nr:polysaccharide deacetylase family protein [Candidatus Coatesbacteria bacterium]
MHLELPPADAVFFHVDLDGLWVHANDMSDHDFRDHEDYVFESGFEMMLEIFKQEKIKSTLFIVGREMEKRKHLELLKQAQSEGHYFANHTYNHPKNLALLDESEKEQEIMKCHDAITANLNVNPVGFRAPAYFLDKKSIAFLKSSGYIYDTSVFPSPYGPLIARLLSIRSKGKRSADQHAFLQPFSIELARRKNKPYYPSSENPYRKGLQKDFIEFPVTCIPFFKFPFHASYVLNSSQLLFRAAKALLYLSKIPVVYLFHLKDFSCDMKKEDLALCSSNPLGYKTQSERVFIIKSILRQLKKIRNPMVIEEYLNFHKI